MTTLFFSFLGTGPYQAIHYQYNERRTEQMEKFVQAAVVQLVFETKPRKAVIAVTDGARREHGAALQSRMAALQIETDFVDIPDGLNEPELWDIFGTIGEKTKGCSKVVFDMTHGFRSLPAVGLLSLAFYRLVHKLDIELFYGVGEAVFPQADVKSFREFGALCECKRAACSGEILNLTPMLSLLPWAESVSEWKRTGRADGIVEQSGPYLKAVKNALKGDAPRALTALPAGLKLLSEALTLVRHDKIGPSAQYVLKGLDEAREQCRDHVPLKPFEAIFDDIQDSVKDLCSFGANWELVNDDYLLHQVRAAKWQADRSRIVEAFSLLREVITSCAVRIGKEAGVLSFPGKSIENSRILPPDPKYRESVDWHCAVLAGATKPTEESDQPKSLEAAQIAEWFTSHPETLRLFKAAYESVREHRNRLDHCWTGGEHSKVGFNKESFQEVRMRLSSAIECTQNLVSALTSDSSRLPTPEPRFLNLSNHPVATWTADQMEAAQSLGFGPPQDLPEGMPLIDPTDDTELVMQTARALALRTLELGAMGATVGGEPATSMALVVALQGLGVRVFTPTTLRQASEESLGENARQKLSVFRFVRWREYPDLRAV